jgi:hypothetical protein
MSRRAKLTEFWSGEVELEVSNIAFNVDYDERREGARTIRTFRPNFVKDGEIFWDPGLKLRGWMKEQVRTIKPSSFETIQYGFKSFTLPSKGPIPIGKTEDLKGDPNFPEKFKLNYELPKEYKIKDYPFMEAIIVKEGSRTRSTFSFYYVFPGPVKVQVQIFCYARNITPQVVKDLMEKVGPWAGLGDRHSAGYGTFKLINFKHEEGTFKL